MVNNYLTENISDAIIAQLKAIPLIEALFSEVNPIPIKEALNLIGYNYGIPRLPLIELSDKGKEKLKIEMSKFGTI